MDLTKLFNDVSVKGPDIKPGTKGTKIFWPFLELTEDMIDGAGSGCGCTQPTVTKTGIEVIYNDSHTEKQAKELGRTHASNSVTIYLKDGKALKVKNDRGVEVFNPDKESIALFFNLKFI